MFPKKASFLCLPLFGLFFACSGNIFAQQAFSSTPIAAAVSAPVPSSIVAMPASGLQASVPIQSGPPRVDPLLALEAKVEQQRLAAQKTTTTLVSSNEDPVSPQAVIESRLPITLQTSIQNVFSTTYAPTGPQLQKDFGWMIPPSDRPNGITLPPTGILTTLMVDVPSVEEVQLKLPGALLDQAEMARLMTLRYFEGSVKEVVEVRKRQHEQLTGWLQYVRGLHSKISVDPWNRWYFSSLVQEHLRPLYLQLLQQSSYDDERILKLSQSYVEKITPLLTASPTQESKIAWYGVLLQFQKGMNSYREQVGQGDRQILALIEVYMQQFPVVPRPDGPKPTAPVAAPLQSSSVNLPAVSAGEGSSPVPVSIKDSSSFSSALVALVMILIVVGFGYTKFRQRVKNKPGL